MELGEWRVEISEHPVGTNAMIEVLELVEDLKGTVSHLLSMPTRPVGSVENPEG